MKRLIYIFLICIICLINPSFAQFIGEWELANGDNPSTVTSYAISGSNLIASTYDGVYLSTNNGSDWVSIKNNLSANFVNAVAVKDNYIFIGTEGYGAFVSTNEGSNWQQINNGLTNMDVKAIAINGDYIYAGTYIGIFQSTDNGNNWVKLDNVFSENLYVYSLVVDENNVFAGTMRGVFLTTDNGNNWTQLNEGLANNHVMSFAFLDNNVFVGTEGGVYLSTNYGTNWVECNPELNNKTISGISIYENYIFAGSAYNGLYYSTDMGANWSLANEGLDNIFIHTLILKNQYIFAGTTTGTYRRELNITSVPLNETDYINSFSIFPNPAENSINIQISQSNVSDAVISIYNSIGEKIKEINIEELNNELSLDIHSLPAGIYILNIISENFSKSKKFSVVR